MNAERMACLYLLQRASHCAVERTAITEELHLPVDFFESVSDDLIADVLPQVLAAVVRLTNDELFAFYAGRHAHPCLLGSVGVAATHAPTLGDLFNTFTSLTECTAEWYRFYEHRTDQHTEWTLKTSGHALADESAAHHLSLAWATGLVSFGRLTNGKAFLAKQVSLQGPAPSKRQVIDQYFGCPVEFDAPQNCVVVRNTCLTAASLIAEPLLFDQLVFAARTIRKQRTESSITDAIDQTVYRGFYELSEVAREIGLNERTIQRRLKEEGTTFQTRLDAVRVEMARTYLRLPSLTVAEIASRLGFSSDRAFRIAYRRWTGRAPRDSVPAE